MATTDTLRTIYNRFRFGGPNCMIAPNMDKRKWTEIQNSIAPKEEPQSVICIGEVDSKGMLGFFSAIKFLFTNDKFYMQDAGSFKLSDIDSISYLEEMKSTLFGFGKEKTEGHLLLKLTNGQTVNLKGNYSTSVIAMFLNAFINELKKNSLPELPDLDYSQTDEIVNKIKKLSSDTVFWSFKPNIDDKILNSIIINDMKKERKASCAAYYSNPSALNKQEICFFGDKMLIKNTTSNQTCVVDYKSLTGGFYKENESDGNLHKQLILYGKERKPIITIEDTSFITDKVIDFFNWLISKETGSVVKISCETIAEKKLKEKKAFEEEQKRNPMEKWDNEKKDYVKISSDADNETWRNMLKKWEEIFSQDWESKTKKEHITIGDIEYKFGNILGYQYSPSLDSINSDDQKRCLYGKYISGHKTLYYFSGRWVSWREPTIWTNAECLLLYIPEPGKSLRLEIAGYRDTNEYRGEPELHLYLNMNSPDISMKFRSRGGPEHLNVFSVLSGFLGIPDFHETIRNFKEKLKKAEEKEMEDINNTENAHKNDFENW
ncbi:MAG: hypothetical protein J5857_00225 [Treponema sp.]|nr:hypothetical protein [Treponema sp.]